jgi:hypothetical protein
MNEKKNLASRFLIKMKLSHRSKKMHLKLTLRTKYGRYSKTKSTKDGQVFAELKKETNYEGERFENGLMLKKSPDRFN